MNTRMRRTLTGAAAAVLISGVALAAPAENRAEKLPPCVPDKPIPAGGCMAPKDPVTPLDSLKPAPPLTVPPSGELRPAPPLTVPPGVVPPTSPSGAPGTDSPAVVKPPPTGDSDILKPAPQTDSKMPVIKPKPGIKPRT